MRVLPFLVVAYALAQPPSPSWQKQVALGRALATDFEKQYPPLDDTLTAAYVSAITDRIGPAIPKHIQLADSKEVLLAVLPGGRLYFTTALISATASEAELAGVVAHAAAHLALGCPPQQSRTLSAVGGCCVRWDNSAPLVPGSLTDSVRDRESEADRLALVWLSDAGYDPLGLLEFFTKWAFERPRIAPFVSSDDLLAMRQKVEESKLKNPLIVTSSAFESVRRKFTPAAPSLYRQR